MTVAIETQVSLEAIANALCSGFEGGTNYWAKLDLEDSCEPENIVEIPGWSETYAHVHWPLSDGGELAIDTAHDYGRFWLSKEKIETGLRIMSVRYPKRFAELVAKDGDADTGDTLIQLALFGELVFG